MYKVVEDFLYNLLTFLKFLYRTIKRENLINYISKRSVVGKKSDILYAVANGPSLQKSFNAAKKQIFSTHGDVIMMNFGANTEEFYELKPKYYCLSDYTFYWFSDYAKEKVELMYANLNNRVDWQMNVYLPYRWYKDKAYLSIFTNPKLIVVPFHTLQYAGFEKFRFKLMLKNIGSADFGTVLQNAINIGIILGYKKLYLLGADHSFFDGLVVNSENQVCRVTSHYYENSAVSKPLYHYFCSGKQTPYTMSFLMAEYAKLFAGHDLMRRFSDYAGTEIINLTNPSMIDSYKRESLSEFV